MKLHTNTVNTGLAIIGYQIVYNKWCHGRKTCDIHCDDGPYAATNYCEGQMTHLEAGGRRHVM